MNGYRIRSGQPVSAVRGTVEDCGTQIDAGLYWVKLLNDKDDHLVHVWGLWRQWPIGCRLFAEGRVIEEGHMEADIEARTR